VGGGHAHSFFVHAHSPLHRLPPECKLLASLLFVLTVVFTPREAFWAFGVYAVVILALTRAARIPLKFLLKRLVIEVPFLAFAVMMPFFGQGERVQVLGMSLSSEGLWAAWNIVAKGTLGLGASIVLGATTQIPEILLGMEKLRAPKAFTSIAGFMVRYLEVIVSDMQRMRVARESRCYNPRWFWQARAVAISAGALFIRSYERGERVYLAMISRGYDGTMPALGNRSALRSEWAASLALPAGAALVAATAWISLR
jgi:cobalt/nickel transport system permease protein